MKNAKRLLSFILTFALMFVSLPVCLPTAASAATTQKAITTIDFESTGGWSDSNNRSYLSVVTDPDDNSNHIMKMTSTNNAGYNMEIANGSSSTSAYILEPSTSYTVSFDYKPIGEYTENDRIAIYLGTAAGWTATTPKLSKGEVKFSQSANPGEWNTLTATFTTTANQTYNEYITSSSYTHVCNKLYIVYSAGAAGTSTTYNAYVDNIIVTNNDAPGEQMKYTTYNFNNNTGISNFGTAGSYTTDPHDRSEKVVKLNSSAYAGATVELAANGSMTTKPYQTLANTSYTVTFDYKLAEGSHDESDIYLYLGAQYAYSESLSKHRLHSIDLAGTTDYTTWHTFTYTFTTTENMYLKEYKKSGDSTAVYDKFYISLSSGVTGNSNTHGSIYIDNVTIINNDYPEKYNNFNFNNKTGLSNMANASNGSAKYVAHPDYDNNYCVLSTSVGHGGATIELAENGNSTAKPFKLELGTSYTVTFNYRVMEGAHTNVELNLYTGYQFGYNADVPKKSLKQVTYTEAVDYTQWYTFSHTFTLTESEYYKTVSGTTYTYDKLYITASIGDGGTTTGGSMYIDDVVIINNDIEGTEPDTDSYYEIKDFTHSPYAENGFGIGADDWKVSGRMYSTTDSTNSVLAYQYSLHPEHITDEFSSSGEGTRGNFMGTNGYDVSSTNLVTSDNTAITIQQDSAYKISFKYKVTSVETGSHIGFAVVRGAYSSAWTSSLAVGTVGQFIFRTEHATTDGWKEVHFTFLADYSISPEKNYLKFGMVGYGTCLIDDIVVEAIDPNDIEPLPDTSDYNFTTSNGKATITAYNGTVANLEIPTYFNGATLNKIDKGAFLLSRMVKNVIIPGGVTEIDSYAFEKAEALETISIPSTVTNIGDRVFYDTKSLTEIQVHSANTAYISVDGVLYNKDMTVLIAYPSAKEDTSFTIPATVTEIAPAAFQGAANLVNITLPASLTKIGENAFRGCSKLSKISIPSSVTEIGASAFRDCSSLATVEVDDTTELGNNAFYGCSEFYTVGNIDSANDINAADALILAKVLAGRTDVSLNLSETLAADVNRDGKLDMLDSAILQRHLAEWPGYEELPSTGRKTENYDAYESTSENPELVLNLTNTTGNYIVSNRDQEYDDTKEDLIIILAIGQSNQGTGVGYASEQSKLAELEALGLPAPEAPTRPSVGTVYSTSSAITELTTSHDAYYLCDTAKAGATYGGSTPALGKALHEATGAKVLFIQSAMGATGMHEWVRDPENYTCNCNENGKGRLYLNAVRKYLKTYYELKDDYNIIFTGYYWNQGEHEEVYAKPGNTVHDVQSYYDAYVSMHTTLMSDCEFDFGGIFMPRSVYQYHPDFMKVANTEANMQIYDTVENSRRTTVARQAMYRVVNDIPEVFVASNYTEKMKYGDDDIVNRIHYAQKTYNIVGAEAAKTILSKLDITSAPEFTGITVYNSQGIILATFDKDGKLTSGSKTVDITNKDNYKLHIAIEPLGTYYTYEISYSNANDFSSDFFEINADSIKDGGHTSFDIVINTPKK